MIHTCEPEPLHHGTEHHASLALPDYASMLAAYHRAYAPELQAIIAALPLRADDRVLDMACGDGTYAGWIAARVAHRGAVIGADISFDYLRLAHQQTRASPWAARIGYTLGDVACLPFADNCFDLVWCAQSLYDFPDALQAVREMRRVVRLGGLVIVLENDRLHHLLLPWPAELELALRQAELQALSQQTQQAEKFYVGRRLRHVFHAAGLSRGEKQTYATNRQTPFDTDMRTFLVGYFHRLRQRVLPYLAPSLLCEFDTTVDPDSPCSLLNRPDVTVTCVDHVIRGVKL
jgi:ubiquinone/menaquinone biosynthesis C-methylase UbiE